MNNGGKTRGCNMSFTITRGLCDGVSAGPAAIYLRDRPFLYLIGAKSRLICRDTVIPGERIARPPPLSRRKPSSRVPCALGDYKTNHANSLTASRRNGHIWFAHPYQPHMTVSSRTKGGRGKRTLRLHSDDLREETWMFLASRLLCDFSHLFIAKDGKESLHNKMTGQL